MELNDQKTLALAANTIRFLAADAVQQANSGHPGMPMGMAELGIAVWLKYLRFNPKDPAWIDRDRFVLSNGHGSMLQYALLHLAGYPLTLDDLKKFRQWESKTPGHPENYMTAGIECTTGPLGQGISNSVGMALAERVLAERYNSASHKIFSHNIFCFAGDGCLMEGVSSEASSLAGHLGLGNLKVIYDDNHISIAGHTELAFSEDVLKRYEAYGWHVARCDGHDLKAIDQAMAEAMKVTDRPSIIAARTIIGKGSPHKADTHDVHGSPLGDDELKATRAALNWPEERFLVPTEVRALFAKRVEELSVEYQTWQKNFSAWESEDATRSAELKKQLKREVPSDLREKLIAALPKDRKPVAIRKLSQIVLNAAAKEVNSLFGGSADLEPSTLTVIAGSPAVQRDKFGGANIHYGVREHGMGALMNGLSYNGAFLPFGSTFLVFADYMRPAIRLAALSHLRGLFIFTHDSVLLGEDGPTHQPIETLQALRLIPNLQVFRPADDVETAVAYAQALKRTDGPAILVFTRQNLDMLERPTGFDNAQIERGAYTLFESAAKPELVFVATGSEVMLALAAAKELSAKTSVRVVSMPCVELFRKQPENYQRELIPDAARRVTIEAGSTGGWREVVGGSRENTLTLGIDRFGASAPQKVLAEKFGFTTPAVVARVREYFKL